MMLLAAQHMLHPSCVSELGCRLHAAPMALRCSRRCRSAPAGVRCSVTDRWCVQEARTVAPGSPGKPAASASGALKLRIRMDGAAAPSSSTAGAAQEASKPSAPVSPKAGGAAGVRDPVLASGAQHPPGQVPGTV